MCVYLLFSMHCEHRQNYGVRLVSPKCSEVYFFLVLVQAAKIMSSLIPKNNREQILRAVNQQSTATSRV